MPMYLNCNRVLKGLIKADKDDTEEELMISPLNAHGCIRNL